MRKSQSTLSFKDQEKAFEQQVLGSGGLNSPTKPRTGNKQAQIELDIEARAAAAKQATMQSAAEDAEAAEVKAAAVAAAATAAEEAALLDQERRLRRDERKCPHTSQAEHCQHFLFHNKPRCCAWYI